jgi:hypothetical protein
VADFRLGMPRNATRSLGVESWKLTGVPVNFFSAAGADS